jgi:predicted nucleic acid-binding protein
MARYYLDTCIWRDFYESRISRDGKAIGECAYNLILKLLSRKQNILFSEFVVMELEREYSEQEIEEMLGFMLNTGLLTRIEPNKDEVNEAKSLAAYRKLPFIDCLNAIMARDNDAILVTRDAHFFQSLKDITDALKPEDII